VNFASKNRVQRTAAASAVVVMLSVSGCSLVAEQSTRMIYSPSDGIVEDLGPVLLRNIMIVGTNDGDTGRFIGTIANTGEDSVDISINAGNASTSITVEGESEFKFEFETADDGTLEGMDTIPGSDLPVEFDVNGEQTTLGIPVLDGTLPEYRDFVPGGYTPRPSEPASTSEASEGE
jgi:hypothetical protein